MTINGAYYVSSEHSDRCGVMCGEALKSMYHRILVDGLIEVGASNHCVHVEIWENYFVIDFRFLSMIVFLSIRITVWSKRRIFLPTVWFSVFLLFTVWTNNGRTIVEFRPRISGPKNDASINSLSFIDIYCSFRSNLLFIESGVNPFLFSFKASSVALRFSLSEDSLSDMIVAIYFPSSSTPIGFKIETSCWTR